MGNFWSKSVFVLLAIVEGVFLKKLGLGSLQTSLLCMVGEIAWEGSVGVAVGVNAN